MSRKGNETSKKDVDYAEQAVPAEGRKGFLTMFMIMLGFTFFSASMWAGQQMAEGLDFWGFLEVPGSWAALILRRLTPDCLAT